MEGGDAEAGIPLLRGAIEALHALRYELLTTTFYSGSAFCDQTAAE
jgi:hypothetical protein